MRRFLSMIGTVVVLAAPQVSLAADPASVVEAVKAGDLGGEGAGHPVS